ncbi:MAG: electron transport complex subunit E [Candidatus Omnitrophica bacterium]|nr:electron transport complex subunit E [Candidatus Omnitrophota bacterium]MCM8802276.1 electron transport complex subunit E [Candidatus Omnitrophota bacterium]
MKKIIDFKVFLNGIWKENPILFIMLGLCPVLAVSGSVKDALGMGIAVIFVLTGSNMVISLIRKIVPSYVRIPVFIVVIATFVTITDYFLAAYSPQIHKNLGVYLPLIVVNCIILGRAEGFASKNNIFNSILDGLGMGIGFTLIIFVISSIREILGNGTFMGKILFTNFNPFLIMIMPPGAFLVIGILIALKQKIEKGKKIC